MIQDRAAVLFNERVAPGYYRMGLACSRGGAQATAGQFVMLKIADRPTPLLRRPFSIHRLIGSGAQVQGIEILYRTVGEMTRALAKTVVGQRVDVVGPLGRGFRIPAGCRKVYMAGGGVGIAPLLFLGESLLESRIAAGDITVFIGGRSRDDLLCGEDFRRLGMGVVVTTDDGSAGNQCLVTHPLEQAIQKERPDMVYACGPPAMLACVAGIVAAGRVPCQISVETMMGCGMGACLGCAMESREETGRYLHACMDGPVFDVGQLKCNFH